MTYALFCCSLLASETPLTLSLCVEYAYNSRSLSVCPSLLSRLLLSATICISPPGFATASRYHTFLLFFALKTLPPLFALSSGLSFNCLSLHLLPMACLCLCNLLSHRPSLVDCSIYFLLVGRNLLFV
ncbi:hypothetical protein BKA62DRAFT_701354 [Auriculariales sp. MPI-PUGE-AT-0066]|nr:hypothetical protein BKA62DRAFT_701354 [Auriculariales sp. MPI-PUGE-AT-0066]